MEEHEMEAFSSMYKNRYTRVNDQLIGGGSNDGTTKPIVHHKSDEADSIPTSGGKASTSLLRSLGLGIVNYYLGHLGHKSFREPTKVVLARSRMISLVRNVVHVVPVAAALAVIYLNLAGFYIGANLENVDALQFAAKLHELTMIASLAQVLLAAVRADLVLGEGLPFGALFSGLQISQPSYLWSMEFLGSVTAPSLTIWKKLRLTVTPLVLILLAATVGPSSAIAMIPRVRSWPAGRTHIWFNATNQDLFPVELRDVAIPTSCANSSSVPIPNTVDVCPSSGWQTLAGLVPFYRSNLGPVGSNWPNISVIRSNNIGAPSTIQIASQDALRSLNLCVSLECTDYMATVQPAPIANALVMIATFWRNSIYDVSDRLSSFRTFNHSIEVLQPFVAVGTGYGYKIEGPYDTNPVSFPGAMDRIGEDSIIMADTINVTSISRSELFDFGEPTQPRLVFVDLTDSGINDTNLGYVMMDPRDPYAEMQSFTTGLIAAGWGLSTMHTSPTSEEGLAKVVQSSGFTGPYVEDSEREMSERRLFPDFPLRKISLSKEWADFTNPNILDLDTSVYSALSASLNLNHALTYNDDRTEAPQEAYDSFQFQHSLLAALIANGLGNLGSEFSLQGNIALSHKYSRPIVDGSQWILHNKDLFTVDPTESADWVRLQVNSSVQGLAYSTEGLPTKFAISILAAYCVVAIAYVLYTSIRGVSSASWDTLAELTALAMNSPPVAELRNTCAGIANLAVFKTHVRVVATYKDDRLTDCNDYNKSAEHNEGHLQLVFGVGQEVTLRDRVQMDEKYGVLAQHSVTDECTPGTDLSLRSRVRKDVVQMS